MSRSVKKNPIIKENSRGSNKERKKIANKILRSKIKIVDEENGSFVGNGSDYKKFYEQWKISDYKFKVTEEEALKIYEDESNPESIHFDPLLLKHYPTEKAFMRWWRKNYKNK